MKFTWALTATAANTSFLCRRRAEMISCPLFRRGKTSLAVLRNSRVSNVGQYPLSLWTTRGSHFSNSVLMPMAWSGLWKNVIICWFRAIILSRAICKTTVSDPAKQVRRTTRRAAHRGEEEEAERNQAKRKRVIPDHEYRERRVSMVQASRAGLRVVSLLRRRSSTPSLLRSPFPVFA